MAAENGVTVEELQIIIGVKYEEALKGLEKIYKAYEELAKAKTPEIGAKLESSMKAASDAASKTARQVSKAAQLEQQQINNTAKAVEKRAQVQANAAKTAIDAEKEQRALLEEIFRKEQEKQNSPAKSALPAEEPRTAQRYKTTMAKCS